MLRANRDETEFSKKLARGSAAIKEAADNNTCGSCAHAVMGDGGVGFCGINENYEGGSLRIFRSTAYACGKFQTR